MARALLGRRVRPYKFRPRLESLEDRNLMSAGALDPTFGAAGVATTDVLPTVNGAHAMVLQSDGRAVLVGDYARTRLWASGFSVVRLNTDGSLDHSFAGGGAVIDFGGNGGSAQAVALQPDGKIVVAGYAAAVPVGAGYATGFAVCRLNRDGTLDTTFGTGGSRASIAMVASTRPSASAASNPRPSQPRMPSRTAWRSNRTARLWSPAMPKRPAMGSRRLMRWPA